MQYPDPDRAPRPRQPRAGGQVGAGPGRAERLILGAIIAGGQARRFGSDKALALLAGRPLIAHAHDAIAPYCDTVVVCGRAWGGLRSLADLPEPGLGPLGGVAAALAYAGHGRFESVLTIACDMPEVPDELLAGIVAEVPTYCEEAPVLGHWPASLAEPLRLRLTACVAAQGGTQPWLPPARVHNNAFSIRNWARNIGAVAIASAPLRNINTPADL